MNDALPVGVASAVAMIATYSVAAAYQLSPATDLPGPTFLRTTASTAPVHHTTDPFFMVHIVLTNESHRPVILDLPGPVVVYVRDRNGNQPARAYHKRCIAAGRGSADDASDVEDDRSADSLVDSNRSIAPGASYSFAHDISCTFHFEPGRYVFEAELPLIRQLGPHDRRTGIAPARSFGFGKSSGSFVVVP